MTRLNDTLPELMRRATDDLEPVSTDLLERTVAQGVRNRRRRNTLRIGAAATAALATTGLIAGGTQILAGKQDAPAATAGDRAVSTTTKATAAAPKAPAVTAKQTLATLRELVEAPGRKVIRTESWGGDGSFKAAAVLVDDGAGASRIEVAVSGGYSPPTDRDRPSCKDRGPDCKIRPDGSVLTWVTAAPEFTDSRQQRHGVIRNSVTIQYRTGRSIALTNYNGPQQKDADHTRPKPLFTVGELTTLADDKAWKFPPAQPLPTGDPKADRNRTKPTK